MQSISTKTGDGGITSLANGKRLEKTALVFELLGQIDELNAWIGYALVVFPSSLNEQKKLLLFLQEQLFVMGGEIAGSPNVSLDDSLLTQLEQQSLALQEEMGAVWHTQFLLPGGVEAAARIDVARTICRRVERWAVRYDQEQSLSPVIKKTLNRLSDYLYLLRCYLNWQAQYQETKFSRKK